MPFLLILLLCNCISEAFSSSQLQETLKESPNWEITLLHVYDLQENGDTFFVDIRSKSSYEKGHVPGD